VCFKNIDLFVSKSLFVVLYIEKVVPLKTDGQKQTINDYKTAI